MKILIVVAFIAGVIVGEYKSCKGRYSFDTGVCYEN